jgi:hypothetical protein
MADRLHGSHLPAGRRHQQGLSWCRWRRPRDGSRRDRNRGRRAGWRLPFMTPIIARSRIVSIHVALNHVTHYTYDRLVNLGPQVDPPASLSAFADADPFVFAEGRSGAALHQLAAGSAGQLPGASGLSGKDARIPHRGRSGGRNVGHQPLRFLPRTARREDPLHLRGVGAPRTAALPVQAAGDAAVPEVPRRHFARGDAQRRFPGRAQRPVAGGHRLHHPHGARRADARRKR